MPAALELRRGGDRHGNGRPVGFLEYEALRRAIPAATRAHNWTLTGVAGAATPVAGIRVRFAADGDLPGQQRAVGLSVSLHLHRVVEALGQVGKGRGLRAVYRC